MVMALENRPRIMGCWRFGEHLALLCPFTEKWRHLVSIKNNGEIEEALKCTLFSIKFPQQKLSSLVTSLNRRPIDRLDPF